MKEVTIARLLRNTMARALAFVALTFALGSWAYTQEQPASSGESTAITTGAGTTGVNTKSYSVIVNVNGTLALGPAGSNSFNLRGQTGVYEVDLPSDVSHCVYTATIGDALADVPAPGLVNVTQRAGNRNGIYVQTFNLNGTRADHPFHLQVQC